MGYKIVPSQGDPFKQDVDPVQARTRQILGEDSGNAFWPTGETTTPAGRKGMALESAVLNYELGGLATNLAKAFMGPGDALMGRSTSEEMEDSARSTALLLGGSGLPAAGENALGIMGGRIRSGGAATERSGYPLDWPKDWSGKKNSWAVFKTPRGTEYRVGFNKEPGGTDSYMVFNAVIGDEEKQELTKLEPNSAHKVLATVLNSTEEYLKRNPEVKTLQFDADLNEPSRVSLYRLVARSLSTDVEERTIGHYMRFRVAVPEIQR